MMNILKFIAFIIYTISIFFVSNWIVLGTLCLINIILGLLFKIDFRKMIHNFLILSPFIIFTVVINIIFESVYFGILIGARLIICYQITYVFSKMFTIMEFAETTQKLFSPLKIFKVNTKNIGMIVSIALCMVPVFKNEMHDLIRAMKAKGQSLKVNNIGILMKPVLISTLRKTSQMESALIAKGYSED